MCELFTGDYTCVAFGRNRPRKTALSRHIVGRVYD